VSNDNGTAVAEFAELTDVYRRELLAHCYRMLGSYQDAEDIVQETLVRAWRGYERFDGRASLRTWLHRIATNACLTALASADRRILPSGLGGPTGLVQRDLPRLDAAPWLQPAPTSGLLDRADDPAAIVALRDSTRLALVAAYQVLPPRQRAVLLLVDVAAFSPAEVADLLSLSVTAVRSLLQRARAAISNALPDQDRVVVSPGLDTEVLRRYLAAFQSGDANQLADLLRADVTYEMPPIVSWFSGRQAVLDHHQRRVFSGPRRALVTSANGYPALAMYTSDDEGSFRAHGIHLLEQAAGSITRIVVFLDPALFPAFGLVPALPGAPHRP
jgi:RNA polymerase sigma-70 factor (ECF subfamily)